jgi:hypothetical protein
VDLFCLVETRVHLEKSSMIKEFIFPGWGFINDCDNHPIGKFWVCCVVSALVSVVSHAEKI